MFIHSTSKIYLLLENDYIKECQYQVNIKC